MNRTVLSSVCILLLFTSTAQAAEPESRTSMPVPELSVAEHDSNGVEWSEDWRKPGKLEAGIGIGGVAASLGYLAEVGPSEEPNWLGGILFDNAMSRTLMPYSGESRRAAAEVSDLLVFGLVGFPVIVDAGLAAGFGHGNWETAGYTSLIAMQSMGLTLITVTLMKGTIGRKRPSENGDTQSFPSGHSAMAFTGAGLICANHEHLDLFGGGWADDLPCYLGTGAAFATAGLRIAADKHYFTDVIVGALIGFASGYLLPKLAYFRTEFGGSEVIGSLMPDVRSGRAGLSLSFRF